MPDISRILTILAATCYAALALAGCALSSRGPRPISEAARDRLFAARSERIVAAMDDEALAAQVLITGIDGTGSLAPGSERPLSASGVGAVMLFKYNLGRGPAAARRLAEESVRAGAVVAGDRLVLPFVAVDHEGGSVHRFARDATRLPSASAFGGLRAARGEDAAAAAVRESAYRSGLELRALGVTLNLAPVAEAADGASAGFLDDRSYGAEAEWVAAAAIAFTEGMDAAGVACALKHFPGNANVDPHYGKATIAADRSALARMVQPFRDAIAASRPAAVMVSHAVVPALDPGVPGTLSRIVVTDWLKGNLGFAGFAVTDDLRMGAIAATGRTPAAAAVAAIAAGADLVMTWPVDMLSVRDAIAAAVGKGELSRDRLRDAARRIVREKMRYGLCPPLYAEGYADTDAASAGEQVDAVLAGFRAETERYLRERGLK